MTDAPHTRSLALTVALRVGVATALVCALVFGVIYWRLGTQSQTMLQETVDTDLAGLIDIYGSKGRDGLAQAIQARLDLAPTQNERPLYALMDKNGHHQAGNLSEWPALDSAHSETGLIEIAPVGPILARATVLHGGQRLLVGRSGVMRAHTLATIRYLFLAAFLLIAGVAWFIGLFAARELNGRVQGINQLFERFGAPDARHRSYAKPQRDEIDELTHNVTHALERVDRLFSAQRDISDHIAHETRTPLMGLAGSLDEALARTDDPVTAQSLQTGKQQVAQTLSLMDALLDIASAEAQQGDLRSLRDVNLSAIAREIAELYAASSEEVGVRLVCDIEDHVVARADPMQVSRMIVNLFDNAFKHAPAATTLIFSLYPGPVLMLEDNGGGIADIDKKLIFDRYKRTSSTAARGHGLGLALVRAIAQRHGWNVHVEDGTSDPNARGARFVIAPKLF
jgi:signal transduction histidine kinase